VRLVADTVSGFKTSEQSSGSQWPKCRQELSKFGAHERTVTILWAKARRVSTHFNQCLCSNDWLLPRYCRLSVRLSVCNDVYCGVQGPCTCIVVFLGRDFLFTSSDTFVVGCCKMSRSTTTQRKTKTVSEWVSSFLTAHQHNIGYVVNTEPPKFPRIVTGSVVT